MIRSPISGVSRSASLSPGAVPGAPPGGGGGYSRANQWFLVDTSGTKIELPFGLAGAVRDSDPIIIEAEWGGTQVANQCIWQAGLWNNATSIAVKCGHTDPELSVDSSNLEARLWSSVKYLSVPSLALSTWNYGRWTLDTVAKTLTVEVYRVGDEAGSRGGIPAFAGAFFDQMTIGDSFWVSGVSNPLFGSFRGAVRNVRLYLGDALLGFWPIDDNDTVIADQSGNGNDGVLTPATSTWTDTNPF